MKYCIVNGDDFGASKGINLGILEAHRNGVLTSTSLIVNMPCSEQAASLSRECPNLSVGLHVNFRTEEGKNALELNDTDSARTELNRQFERFRSLLDCLPTHIDSHHNVHRDPRLKPLFYELAAHYQLPLRENSPVRYFSKFYGQWDGETHFEQISVANLIKMLGQEIHDGITELSCHPGYPDPYFQSAYAVEREAELRTLCDPRVRSSLAVLQIRLVNYGMLAEFL